MTIESTTTTSVGRGKKFAQKIIAAAAYGLLITFAVVTVLVVIGSNSRPTGSYLSPVPSGELAQDTSSDGGRSKAKDSSEVGSATNTKSVPELINLAQNYLGKAFEIAKSPNQTQQQKDQILNNLDQSLSLTSQAISQEPNNPNGYVLRAQILTAISKANPNALSQAQKDLEIAQSLSQGQPIALPKATNPINLLPDKQAIAKADFILAAPQNELSGASSEVTSNSFTNKITLPAGQTELTVENPKISDSSYIYLIPQTKTNTPVFIKSKASGKFTVSAATAPEADLIINYYLINP